MQQPQLGDKIRDVITGLEGIMVCRSEWLNKCVRVTIQPQEAKDGKPVDSYCCDIEQVEVIKRGAFEVKKSPTGGPMPNVTRAADPTR
jgi:hypothetical protein